MLGRVEESNGKTCERDFDKDGIGAWRERSVVWVSEWQKWYCEMLCHCGRNDQTLAAVTRATESG
jgi:hypothetical protein